jgi:ribosomal protein S12 methylthiotransferase accessory factor
MEMTITMPRGDRVEAAFDGLTVATDQDGSAPSPFALFLASIGTCAGIYVARFCRQRGIATEGIRIRQEITTNPDTGLVESIGLDIELPPGFPQEYADAVVRSAQLCTVKKHLERPPAIAVRAVASSR